MYKVHIRNYTLKKIVVGFELWQNINYIATVFSRAPNTPSARNVTYQLFVR